MKKIIAIVLSVALCISLNLVSFAANETNTLGVTFSAELDKTSLSVSDKDQQVVLTVKASPAVSTSSISYTATAKDLQITSLEGDGTNVTDATTNLTTGKFSWSASGGAATTIETLAKVTIKVPANTAAGTYELGVTGIKLSKDFGMTIIENDASASATLTITEAAPVSKGYTVSMSSDAPSAGVAKEGPFKVNLDVTNSDSTVEKFNAFSATLSYSKDLVSYTGETEISGFEIENKTDGAEGTLKITKKGENVSISKSPDLELPFVAKEVGSATFTLQSASVKVDVAENAETDAPEAQIAGSPLTVTIIETTPEQKPVVTNVNGVEDKDQPSYTGSGEQTQYQKIVATIDTAGYVPTYDGNEMYLVEGDGYAANTYYYVIKASETYDDNKLGYKEGTATTIPQNDNDVNQTTHIDINDAQFVYNIYNDGAWPTKNKVVRLILADTNRNGTVDTSDCVPIIQAI